MWLSEVQMGRAYLLSIQWLLESISDAALLHGDAEAFIILRPAFYWSSYAKVRHIWPLSCAAS